MQAGGSDTYYTNESTGQPSRQASACTPRDTLIDTLAAMVRVFTRSRARGWLRRLPAFAALLPLGSVCIQPSTPWVVRLAAAGLAILSWCQPSSGVLTAIALVPFGELLGWLAGTGPLGEVIVLSAIAPAWWRLADSPAWEDARVQRILWPAIILASVVVAALLVGVSVAQLRTDYPLEFLRHDALRLLAGDPHLAERTGMSWTARLILEGVALMLVVAVTARSSEREPDRVARMILAGGSGVAMLSVYRLIETSLRTGDLLSGMLERWSRLRVAIAIPDVNAAGSYFALLLPLAAALAPASPGVILPAAGLLAIGLWLTASRAALVAVPAAVVAWLLLHGRPRARQFAAAGLIVLVMIGAAAVYPRDNPDRAAGSAVRVRLELARVALRMFETAPVFGVGLGTFYERSAEFIPTDLRPTYPRENAHNQFLQVLAELGLAGLGAFLWLVAASLGPAPAADRALHVGLWVGLVAFLITALGGHPLLTREVALTFFPGLGLAAALREAPHGPPTWPRRVAMACAVVVLLSVMPRAVAARRAEDLEHLGYGVGPWQRSADGTSYRLATGQARVFLPGRAGQAVLTVASVGAAQAQLSLAVNGVEVASLPVGPEWKRVPLLLPGDAGLPYMTIDLLARSGGRACAVRIGKVSWSE